MKVKELSNNWTTIHFPDRAIIKADLKYMSKEQIENFLDTDVEILPLVKGHYKAI